MRPIRHACIATVLLLALTGCASGQEGAQGRPTRESAPAQATPSEAATAVPTAGDATGAAPQAPAVLELTTAAGASALALTEVYCSGSPGQLRHLIAKTDQQPPLVEFTANEFAMVKLGRGRPYTSKDITRVRVDENGVTFNGTMLGEATLRGTVTCTTWQD